MADQSEGYIRSTTATIPAGKDQFAESSSGMGHQGMSQKLWHYVRRAWALKAWKEWLSWDMRCRLEPMTKAAKTIKTHLWGIINAIILKASKGPAKSINSRIKIVKVRARGFRNKQRFANAIYFYPGVLDLYPVDVQKQVAHS